MIRQRNYETDHLVAPRAAHRRLTIDLTLPKQGSRKTTYQWTLPVAWLGKDPPTPFIDLRDETGDALPLPSRAENAQITRAALLGLFRDLRGTPEQDEVLTDAVTALVFQDPPMSARTGHDVLVQVLDDLGYQRSQRLNEVLRRLIESNVVWLPISGRPEQKRLVKLSYDIRLVAPVVPARKESPRRQRLGLELTTTWAKGPVDVRETLRRMRARTAARMGWDAIDIRLDDPALQDPLSYHLQIRLPSELEVTQAELDPPIAEKGVLRTKDNRHVYISAERPRRTKAVILKIRAGRRGFLNASVGGTLVIMGLLWGYVLKSGTVTNVADVSPGAAVLVLAPALMVLFVTRPAESMLVSALLTGVRTAVAFSAVCSTLAAAALAGVRPTDHARPWLAVAATGATVSFISILVAWLGSFHLVRKFGNQARLFWCDRAANRRPWSLAACWGACLALCAWAALVWTNALAINRHPIPRMGSLAVVLLLALLVRFPGRSGSASRGSVLLTFSVVVAAITLILGGIFQLPHGPSAPVRIAAFAAAATLLALATIALVSAELAPMEAVGPDDF
jgi:hypothetical protein